MAIVMILGLAVFPAKGTGLSSCNSSATCNVSTTAFQDVVIGIRSDDSVVCIVYLETADAGASVPTAACAGADIVQQLPDVTTLVLLGLGGLLYRRRKQ